MPAHRDLSGQKFNGVEVLRVSHVSAKHAYHYVCRCYCGNEFIAEGDRLRRGRKKSCGCLPEGLKHGQKDTPEYGIWNAMKARCLNPNVVAFKDYGGRGITVCERWLNFRNFFADMGPRPSRQHSIDRIDNDGSYEPGNCRWATKREQRLNSRNTTRITYLGKTQSISEWAEQLGIKYNTLHLRIKKKWPVERAMTRRVRSGPG